MAAAAAATEWARAADHQVSTGELISSSEPTRWATGYDHSASSSQVWPRSLLDEPAGSDREMLQPPVARMVHHGGTLSSASKSFNKKAPREPQALELTRKLTDDQKIDTGMMIKFGYVISLLRSHSFISTLTHSPNHSFRIYLPASQLSPLRRRQRLRWLVSLAP